MWTKYDIRQNTSLYDWHILDTGPFFWSDIGSEEEHHWRRWGPLCGVQTWLHKDP